MMTDADMCEARAALSDAIKAVGSRDKLAEKLGITGAAISQWGGIVPPARLFHVAAHSGVSIERLRPDLTKPASARAS